jgi:HEAT repeat protein
MLAEAELIQVIESDAGWVEKQAACRGLRQMGTKQCIPALGALLTDENLSHMARYALEAMPYPAAGEALRAALGAVKGPVKAGVVTSLGVRRDTEAVPLLVPLLHDDDAAVVRATAGALGRIATREAVQGLLDFRERAPEAVRPALAEGLLTAGQRLVEDGQGKQAAVIYEELLRDDWPLYVRMGAFRGMAYARPKQAPARLIGALRGDEPGFRDLAAQIVAETSGKKMTKQYAKALPKLPASGQVALLRGLAGRRDPAARGAVAEATESADRQVRLAAVKALGEVGGPTDVKALAGMLIAEDAEIVEAARASLTAMQDDGVNAAMADIVPSVAPPVRAQLLELLASRRADEAVPVAVKSLDDSDATVRIAGLRVLALLAGQKQGPAVVAALRESSDSSARAAAEKALTAICSRRGGAMLPAVLDGMKGADAESRVVLLRGLGIIGEPEALQSVLAAVDDADKPVSEEAVRVLSNWPTMDAAPHLRELAASGNLGRHVLGLRGYVRLARAEPSIDRRTGMLTEAMGFARRPDEKKLILAAWGTVPTTQSLDALVPHLDDKAVRNEAATAIVAVAGEVGKTEKERATTALNAVLEKCSDEAIRKSAQETSRELK